MAKKRKIDNRVGPRTDLYKSEPKKSVMALGFGFGILAALQAGTQYFASQFNYAAALGENYNKIYMPWKLIQWYMTWKGQYPNQFQSAFGASAITLTIVLMLIAVYKVRMRKDNTQQTLHGSARWADKQDIQAAGLLALKEEDSQGVYVGGWVDDKDKLHYLRHNGPEHVLTYAPTRSGKGVGLVMPTLLSWPHSCVVTDLKGELWALTAGWRKHHANNKTIKFEPASPDSAKWNCLEEIRVGTANEVGDVQNLASLIVDPDGKGLESHWDKTAHSLLCGVILHAVYVGMHKGQPASLATVDRMLSDPDKPLDELWTEMITYRHFDGKTISLIASSAQDIKNKPEEEAGSVISTAISYLQLYRDHIVATNVGSSDFHIKDLMNYDQPVTLYIVTQPTDKARVRPLIRILVNMIFRVLADKMEFVNGQAKSVNKYRLLCMFDEFPSLGKLEIIQESLAFVAGYGIKCYLITQDLNQLKSKETGYGPDEVITSNCHVQNAYPPNRLETAEHLSRLTGTTTVVHTQTTNSGKKTSIALDNTSLTVQAVSRPLLTPDECMRLPGPVKDPSGKITKAGDMVVYVAGFPAIYGRQILFFQDPAFAARSQVKTPSKTDVLPCTVKVIKPKIMTHIADGKEVSHEKDEMVEMTPMQLTQYKIEMKTKRAEAG